MKRIFLSLTLSGALLSAGGDIAINYDDVYDDYPEEQYVPVEDYEPVEVYEEPMEEEYIVPTVTPKPVKVVVPTAIPTPVKVVPTATPIPRKLVKQVSGPYIGLGISGAKDDGHCCENDDYFVGFNGRAGYAFNKYVSFEARVNRVFGDAGVMSFYGGYIKPSLLFLGSTTLYGLLGYGVDGFSDNSNQGFSLGAGVEWFPTDSFGVYSDYQQLNVFKDNGNQKMLNVGVIYKF